MNINEPAPTAAIALPFTKAADPYATFHRDAFKSKILRKIPDSYRNHFVAMCGEFIGTILFLYFALSGAQVANSIPSSAGLTVAQTGSNPQQLQYIALSFGFSLAVNAWVFFRISGGLFNPAVTLGMCLIGALPWVRGCLLFFTQILGGICASALVSCMFPGNLNVQTTLGGGTSIVRGLFIEMMLTAQLVFTIFMLAAEKHRGTFIAPVGIGLSLFVAELTGVYFTGGSLNPARSFGPAVVDRSFVGYHWIYWVGPMLGAIVATGFYKLIKVLEYETVNPGQDDANSAHDLVIHESNQRNADGTYATVHSNLSKEYRESPSGTFTNGTTAPTTTTATTAPAARPAARTTDSGMGALSSGVFARPVPVARPSQRVRTDSPAVNTADEAFSGLATGMNGEHRSEPTRIHSEKDASNMV